MAPSERAGDDADAEAGRDAQQRRQRMALQFAGRAKLGRRSRRSPTAAAPAGRSTSPRCTASSQRTASADRQQQAERRPRRSAPGASARPCAAPACAGSAAIGHGDKRHDRPPIASATPRHCERGAAQTPSCGMRAVAGPSDAASVRQRRLAVVDQVVDRRLDVDVGLDHAGLLQREAGLQDRIRAAARRSCCGSARCAP